MSSHVFDSSEFDYALTFWIRPLLTLLELTDDDFLNFGTEKSFKQIFSEIEIPHGQFSIVFT